MSNKSLVVEGIAFYAAVHTPNELADAYTIDLAVDDANAKILEDAGLQAAKKRDGSAVVHDGAEGLKVFKFKRKRISKDGTVLAKPQVVDAANNPVTTLIGNGSKVRTHVTVFPYTFKGKSGVSGGLNGVQILELVEFTAKKLFDETDGFVADSTQDILDADDSVI